ncbi:hypothetical protein HPB52_019087 [Rhipicephalus sanguineus]|uniref:Proline dehydrogenase n=1 Tax=Rhipicephalus sanguineus TaxID=34632 RepID=A0A9D4PX36_RHISA|nr:hypothetical protein HPB52_019087 [Rhipicephalus sanguineus]
MTRRLRNVVLERLMQSRLLRLGQRVLGRRLFRALMRNTFYGHFVGGESASAIQPLLQRLRSFGVKAILDYSAEEDLSEQEAKQAEMAAIRDKIEDFGELKFTCATGTEISTGRRSWHVSAHPARAPLAWQTGGRKPRLVQGGHLRQFQPSEQFADRRHPHVMARTYFYLNEAQCEKNMDIFLECIDAVAGNFLSAENMGGLQALSFMKFAADAQAE